MDFGKAAPDELGKIDFTLPADHPRTAKILGKAKTAETAFYVGCAKWGRKEWIGSVYPKDTPEAEFLTEYTKKFNCVELNATFYKLPSVRQVTEWREKALPGFKFCPKVNDKITHIKRLKDAGEYTDVFIKGVRAFGDHLGPSLLQLPPNYPPKNFETLKEYLQTWPGDIPVSVEFRNPKWFENKASDEVFSMLEEVSRGAAITDAAGRRDALHMRLTTPVAFIRFVGNGLHPTDYPRLDQWAQRIQLWQSQGLQQLYFFIHQDDETHSPTLCKYLMEQINFHCRANLQIPALSVSA